MLCILFIYWECTIISVYQFHIWKPQQKADTIEEAGEEEKNYCYNNNKATRRSEWISIKNDGMATKNHNNEKWANELAWSLSISFRLPLYTINFIYSTNRLYRESMVVSICLCVCVRCSATIWVYVCNSSINFYYNFWQGGNEYSKKSIIEKCDKDKKKLNFLYNSGITRRRWILLTKAILLAPQSQF